MSWMASSPPAGHWFTYYRIQKGKAEQGAQEAILEAGLFGGLVFFCGGAMQTPKGYYVRYFH